ncbi:MAG TPA: GYD domain-containing protein [Terriglobia bacterium]|nr:GYD domain-containing protein [Terriglobia bacterium]
MPHYLCEVAYSSQGWTAVVEKPQNRIEAIRPAVEKLGGKIKDAWFAFGDYDIIALLEMPDNINAAALSIAFSAGGACRSVKTTPLLSIEDGIEAIKRAGKSGYRPPFAS